MKKEPSTLGLLAYSVLFVAQQICALACFVIAGYLFLTGKSEEAVHVLTLAFVAGIASDVMKMKMKHEWGGYR